MSQGPSLLFDKSTLESLSINEAVLLDNFYRSNITPLFFVECLADLEREMFRMKGTPEQLVGSLAERTPDCQSSAKAALLARQSHEASHQASCEGKWHSQEDRLAYFPSLLRHLAEGEWRRRQDGSGALTAREQQNNARCLHASGELEQASRTEQGCKDDGL
jgi:hypothetical protein